MTTDQLLALLDSPIQTVLSVIAFAFWSYVVWIARQRQAAAITVWVITVLFAISSLHYVDAIGSDVGRAIALLLRFVLIVSAIVVIVAVRRRRHAELGPWT